jgi:TonB family protein
MRSSPALALAFVLILPAPALAHEVDVAAVEVIDAVPQGPSVQERLAEIRLRIQSALVYPPSARQRGLAGVSELEFVIGVDGHAGEVELVASSGHRILDRAARRSLNAAGELPRVYGRLRVPVRFDLED